MIGIIIKRELVQKEACIRNERVGKIEKNAHIKYHNAHHVPS